MKYILLIFKVILYSVLRSPVLFTQKLPKILLIVSLFGYMVLTLYISNNVLDSFLAMENLYDKFSIFSFSIFSIDIIVRILFRKIPQNVLIPFHLAPINRKSLVNLFMFKSLLNFYNLNWIIVLIPILIMHLKLSEVLIPFLGFSVIVILTDYLSVLAKLSRKGFLLISTTILFLNLFFATEVNSIFGSILMKLKEQDVLTVIGLFALLIISNFVVTTVLLGHSYKNHDFSNNLTQKYSEWGLFSGKYILTLLQFKLIFRNRRTFSLMGSTIVLIVLSVFLIFKTKGENLLIEYYFFTCLIGALTFTLGPHLFSIESGYLNFLHCNEISYRRYIKAKYNLLNMSSVIVFVVSFPFLFFSVNDFIIYLSNLLLVIGICNQLSIWLGIQFSRRIELNQSSFANAQGVDFLQMITLLLISFIPIFLFLFVKENIQPPFDIIVLYSIATVPFLFLRKSMEYLLNKFKSTKYLKITIQWNQRNSQY